MTPNPLFVTGTARSGSTLLARMLSAHPEVMVASDAYLPLFRSLRDSALRGSGDPTLAAYAELPFQDYYFTDERLRALDLIQAANLAAPVNPSCWSALRAAVTARAAYESPDLRPLLGQLGGDTHRQAFENALRIVAKGRKAEARRFVGCKEVWVVELFAPLARAFPEARFVVLLRDPRATLASMLALADRDPPQRAHVLSYLRHWRKYVAFVDHYRGEPLFAGRLHVLNYELLASAPREAAQGLCASLGLELHRDMLDPEKYLDYATGQAWKGNSSFEAGSGGLANAALDRWRRRLDRTLLRLCELVAEPEMALAGYEAESDPGARRSDRAVLDLLVEDDRADLSWRSDLREPERDYRLELSRAELVERDPAPTVEQARRGFLFQEVLDHLRARRVTQTA